MSEQREIMVAAIGPNAIILVFGPLKDAGFSPLFVSEDKAEVVIEIYNSTSGSERGRGKKIIINAPMEVVDRLKNKGLIALGQNFGPQELKKAVQEALAA